MDNDENIFIKEYIYPQKIDYEGKNKHKIYIKID